ncbi:MAG: Helicase associated domain protein [Actinobacteria bacterium]|nr:Helicase associated domain protein [Actinomycetota bacterium]
MQTSALREPRDHQVEALSALDSVLQGHDRAQLVMACGTGKTLVGRWYAERVGAAVSVVVVPSLNLVAQTLREWRSGGGWPFQALITCSDASTADGVGERADGDGQDIADSFWTRLRARVTTDAAVVTTRLSGRSAEQPLVIFSTYHSLHVVAEAARSAKVVVDIVIADEAHTLAGQSRADFRVALDEKLPAKRRVFMTATPVVSSNDDASQEDSELLSMDDAARFGPVAYRLDFAEAIARGLLVDYRVLVYETPRAGVTPDPIAALAVAARQGVASVLSFHGRVAKARAFAEAIDGHRLEDGRTVVARAVAGVDPTAQREDALEMLSSARPDQLVVISSARCLSVGVDIPAVDGVLFADPKNSDVDVIQSVGRALRTAPGKDVGMVMIPVCVPAGLDDDTVLSSGDFAAVWRILRGLRSMDSRLRAEIREITRQRSRRGERDGSRGSHIEFDLHSLAEPERFHARVVEFLSPAWDLVLSEVHQFIAEHGHARPGRGTRLGEWCERQRRAHRRGMLAPERVDQLSSLPGWTWDLAEQRWLDQWRQVHDLAGAAGQGLDVEDPQIAQIALQRVEHRSAVTTVGRWCAWQRQLARRGELDDRRRLRLDHVPGWSWSAVSAEDARALDLLGEYVAWKGHANPPADVVEDGVPLGQWLNTVRRRRVTGALTQSLLDEIECVTPSRSAEGALRWYRGATLWLIGLEALRQFVSREGHCHPPYSHYEDLLDSSLPLYDWCTRQRHLFRHGHLVAARARLLAAVPGWQWERERAPRVLRDIGDARHGTRTGYVKGCTCDECTEANRAKEAERAARAAAGGPSTDLTDAGSARAHLEQLVGAGATQKALARACDLNVKTIVEIVVGETKRILPETESAILAVTLADVRKAVAPGTRVDAGPTWELIDDMIARNWPKSWIAREAGLGTSLQLRRDTITAASADRIAGLARRLGTRRAPAKRFRQPVPTLSEVLAQESTASQSVDSDSYSWARSLLQQGYRIERVAERSGLPVEVVTALAGNDIADAQVAS